jgi:hypothetical protein
MTVQSYHDKTARGNRRSARSTNDHWNLWTRSFIAGCSSPLESPVQIGEQETLSEGRGKKYRARANSVPRQAKICELSGAESIALSCADRPRKAEGSEGQGSHLQNLDGQRRRDFVVVRIKSARLAERGRLPLQDSAASQDVQSPRNIRSYRSLEALRRTRPRVPTETAFHGTGKS